MKTKKKPIAGTNKQFKKFLASKKNRKAEDLCKTNAGFQAFLDKKNSKKWDFARRNGARKLHDLEKSFAEQAELFIHIMKEGGGVYNVHMLTVLNSLQFVYLRLAAQKGTLEDLMGAE